MRLSVLGHISACGGIPVGVRARETGAGIEPSGNFHYRQLNRESMNMVRVIKCLRVLPSLTACLALAALAGCGGDSSKATVSGKVTYKGARR